MSANNWTMCPKCVERWENKIREFKTTIKAQYGKISFEDYRKLEQEYDEACYNIDEKDYTLREDWEIGIYDGRFRVSYGASCQAQDCDYEYIYEFEDNVP